MRVLVCGSRDWADANLVYYDGYVRAEEYAADWKKHGRAAGPIRNQQMLDEGKPDLVLAFWKNKSRGTADMIQRSRKAGVEVRVIEG